MAYKHTNSKGVTYYLNSKAVTLRGGKEQTIFYFSKDERPEASDLPADKVVKETKDFLISNIKISNEKISGIISEKTEKLGYLPNSEHPFDHFIVKAKISHQISQ